MFLKKNDAQEIHIAKIRFDGYVRGGFMHEL